MEIPIFSLASLSVIAGALLVSGCGGGSSNGPSTPGAGASGNTGLAGRIAFVSTRDGNPDIYLADANGSNQRALSALNSANTEASPSISRDGQTIVWSSDRPNGSGVNNFEIYAQRSDGAGGRRIDAYTNDSGNFQPNDTEPVISPDGSKIAWTTTRGGNPNIAVMNIDGSNQVTLTTNPDDDSQPAWTSDSQSIAFFSERDNRQGIYIMDADGSNQRALLTDAVGQRGSTLYSQPAFAPDGQKFAVTLMTESVQAISVRNLDGTAATQGANITPDGARRSQPSFSRNSQNLIFRASNGTNDSDQTQLRIANSDGSGERTLTTQGNNYDARFGN